jgi:tRNA pseudouridine38-40 synthase
MRYFFEIAYNGTHYHGWQNQANAIGVQQVVENALSKLLHEEIEIVGSGRTDAGVHCRQQFFHADIDTEFDSGSFLVRVNSFLPKDIAICKIRRAIPSAHARYNAIDRSYVYKITQVKDPFLNGYAYYFFKPVDILLMNQACALLVGIHDFESFCKVKTDVNNFKCEIKKAMWIKKNDLLFFEITANRFLRGMVRAIVGTMLELGSGKISLSDFNQIIESKDRKKAGMNVPPDGLYLNKVTYSNHLFIKS